MLLDRNKLLARDTFKIEKVELENDDFVYVRQMSGHERDLFEKSIMKEVKDNTGRIISYQQQLEDFRAKLVVNVICDETGKNLLKPEDYKLLSENMTATKLDKILAKAQELNKISESDKEAMIKNSEPGQSEDNTSESAGNSDTPIPIDGLMN